MRYQVKQMSDAADYFDRLTWRTSGAPMGLGEQTPVLKMANDSDLFAEAGSLPILSGSSAALLFEKDINFFQLLLVLINKSCPIRNVDLVWKSDDQGESGLVQITGTVQALNGPAARYVASEADNLTPKFCEIVSTGCSACDKAAEARVGQTGKPEIYRCHAGLIDIAIPVICDGQHIATLFTGQVLRSNPSDASYTQVLRDVSRIAGIDHEKLKAAYFEVPVVSEDDIRHTVSILETFASYLATTWRRLLAVSAAKQLHLRELHLLRKEMAQILLGGHAPEEPRLREIAGTLGFSRFPNRMMVIRAGDEWGANGEGQSDLERAQTVFALEDLTGKMKEVMAVHLQRQGICVFLVNHPGTADGLGEIKVYSIAQKIVRSLRQKYGLSVRVGIGRTKSEWHRLSESLQEAWAALAESDATIALYKNSSASLGFLSNQIALVCHALSRGDLKAADSALQCVFVSANRMDGNAGNSIPRVRNCLTLAFDMILLYAQGLFYDSESVDLWKREAFGSLECAATVPELYDAWTKSAQKLIVGTRALYTGRHEKIVDRAVALIQKKIDRPEGSSQVSISEIAASLGVSQGHLSRTFKKAVGVSLEQYVIERRIERACHLLLNPANRISEVAEKCDFCNATYFARVFRKTIGCSPLEFSQHPDHYKVSRVPQRPKAAAFRA